MAGGDESAIYSYYQTQNYAAYFANSDINIGIKSSNYYAPHPIFILTQNDDNSKY